jgi:hypothetical protein
VVLMPMFEMEIEQTRKGTVRVDAANKDEARTKLHGWTVEQLTNAAEWKTDKLSFGEIHQRE